MRSHKSLPVKARIRRRRRLRKRRFLVFAVLVILTACYVGYTLIKNISTEYIPVSNVKKSTTGQTFIVTQSSTVKVSTPLPQIKTTAGKNSLEKAGINYETLKNDLQEYVRGCSGTYGIYFLSLDDGYEFGINDKDTFIAASTIKIPINLYLFNRINDGSVNPEGILKYLKTDYEDGTGRIRYQPFGKRYTVRELSRLSIVDSDNVAANMLLRLLGLKNVKNYMRKVGGTVVDDNENVTCPRDMGLYMKLVNDFAGWNKGLGEELIGYLTSTSSSDRIPKLLPKDIKVAHKIGNQIKAVHDVGIVYADKPYILAVLSKNADVDEANNTIANISKKIYEVVK